jgi:hypothetical protein
MRKLAIALVASIMVGMAVPAVAQVGFYAGPGGIAVGVGPGYYGSPYYGYSGPYYGYDGGPYWHHRHYYRWHHHYVR